MAIKMIQGPYGTFDEALLRRVESMFAGENLLQVILHAHLLLERAVQLKIVEKLLRPDVLRSKRFAHLSFAQQIGMFVGLTDPKRSTEELLLAFNRLRNAIAHELDDAESAVTQHLLPALVAYMKGNDSRMDPPDKPLNMVRSAFMVLAYVELGALHGTYRDDA